MLRRLTVCGFLLLLLGGFINWECFMGKYININLFANNGDDGLRWPTMMAYDDIRVRFKPFT